MVEVAIKETQTATAEGMGNNSAKASNVTNIECTVSATELHETVEEEGLPVIHLHPEEDLVCHVDAVELEAEGRFMDSSSSVAWDAPLEEAVLVSNCSQDLDLGDTQVDTEERAQLIGIMTSPPATKDQRIGLGLQKNRVSRIDDWSLFSDTPLRTGDLLLSINGMNCEGMPATRIAKALRSTPPSEFLQIIAYNKSGRVDWIESMISKRSSSDLLGLKLKGNTSRNGAKVSQIDPKGLVAHSLLNVDDKLIQVNSVPCSELNVQGVVQIIQRCIKSVTFVSQVAKDVGVAVSQSPSGSIKTCSIASALTRRAIDPPSSRTNRTEMAARFVEPDVVVEELNVRPQFIAIMLRTGEQHQGIGITLRGNTIIRIAESSILSDSALQPGDKIIKINGEGCEHLSTLDIVRRIKGTGYGFVNIVAHNEQGKIDLVHFLIAGLSPTDRLGVKLRGKRDNFVRIDQLERGGLLARTFLKKGDKVVNINGFSGFNIATQDAEQIVGNTQQRLNFLAKCSKASLRIALPSLRRQSLP